MCQATMTPEWRYKQPSTRSQAIAAKEVRLQMTGTVRCYAANNSTHQVRSQLALRQKGHSQHLHDLGTITSIIRAKEQSDRDPVSSSETQLSLKP